MANNTRSGGREGRGNRGREGRVWERRKRGKGQKNRDVLLTNVESWIRQGCPRLLQGW